MIKEKLNQIAPVNMAVVAANVIVFFIMEILGDTKIRCLCLSMVHPLRRLFLKNTNTGGF